MLEPAARLICPECRGELRPEAGGLRCGRCPRSFREEDGIPVLASLDGDEYKRRQAAFFDEDASQEYETVRPRGTPAWHRWLLEEKFRRSLSGLDLDLAGITALTVCGGSGMDAEFLARRGARVITADISLGAAKRARERALRFRAAVASIVADAERLPFADRSIDLVYVHDGLHHLADPVAALREMARVAAHAISVNEPARAGLTALAVRLGLAQEREEAGNRVERLGLADVCAEVRAQGFEIMAAERYGMLYRHEPGLPSRLLSARVLLPAARGALIAANRAAGRFGNRLTVQAVRPAADRS